MPWPPPATTKRCFTTVRPTTTFSPHPTILSYVARTTSSSIKPRVLIARTPTPPPDSTKALLFDGSTDDYFRGTANFAVLRGQNYEFFNYAGSFDRTYAYASTGNDLAYLEDGVSDDYFRATPDFAVLRGNNYEFFNYAQGFDEVHGSSLAGGNDSAHLYDSQENDQLTVRQAYFSLAGANYLKQSRWLRVRLRVRRRGRREHGRRGGGARLRVYQDWSLELTAADAARRYAARRNEP